MNSVKTPTAPSIHQTLPLLLSASPNSTIDNSLVLKSLLVLDLVLLDKFHRRSNLSLLLIHLRSQIDALLDDPSLDSLSHTEFLEKINSILCSFDGIFIHSNHYALCEIHSIYKKFILSIKNSNNITIPYIDQFICCSNSMAIFIHFNLQTPDNDDLTKFEENSLKSYYTSSFTKSLKFHNQSPLLTKENLKIVKSPDFINFHLSRWKKLNLLDTHIFKP